MFGFIGLLNSISLYTLIAFHLNINLASQLLKELCWSEGSNGLKLTSAALRERGSLAIKRNSRDHFSHYF